MASTRAKVGIVGVVVAAATVTTTMLMITVSDINVPVGGDVQAAVNSAPCGATIVLEAGQTYNGNITLPKKDCQEAITIRSSRTAELPEGQRVGPAQAALFARLQSTVNAEPVVKAVIGAHHYRFIGIKFDTRDENIFVYDLIRLGEGRQTQTTPDSVPRHITIDRSWVAGRANQQTQRGVSLNCADCGVTNSYIDNIIASGMDTQAICAWNTPGPIHIINNYLSATGENVLLGGADPANEAFIPSNVEIRRNHLYKPMEWKGRRYTIKNLLELKNGKNITIDANTIENNWSGEGQAGPGVLFTVRNQEGSAPYSIITNVAFTNNVVRNSEGALNLLGVDNEKPSAQSSALLIKNNVFDQITGHFLTMNGYNDVTLEENTHLQTCSAGCNTMTLYGNPSLRFAYRRNVTEERDYGIYGDGGLIGKPALDKWAPGADVSGNVIAKPYGNGFGYPPNNEYPPGLVITTDYRTPYAGKGANIDAILAAQAGVVVGGPTPWPSVVVSPSPTPVPSPIPTLSPSPIPSPSPVPSPTTAPTPSPSPIVSPSPLRFCRSGERPGNPPVCRCLRGFQGNSGKCR